MEKRQPIPDCPRAAWEEIYRIAKHGNDAVVKIRNGEIQVIERQSKLKHKETLATG